MPATNLRLEDLLSPTTRETFFRDAWEKTPLVVARDNGGHYEGLLSRRDVDDIIAFSRPKFTDPGAFRPAAPARATYVRGVLADQPALSASTGHQPGLAEVRQVFDRGKSVVIMAMQHRWPAVATLCRNLEAVFHCPVHANLYLTPAGSQGFAAHFDPHEVFVLQLEGAKHWRVYDQPETLPLSDNLGTPQLPLGASQEVSLHAGDLLYIPRGHVHEAFTSDSFSLHLTVGINVYRWADLLQHALTQISRQEAQFRESIPGGALPGDPSALRGQFQRLLVRLATSASGDEAFDAALRSLGDQFFGELQMLPGSQFAAPTDVDRLDLETVLERHPQALCRVVEEGPGVAIEFPGNRVSGPPRIATALHFVAGTQRFAVRELPGELNAEAKVVLARRLLREGLLRVVIPPPPEAVADDNTPSREVEAETAPATMGWETHESARQVQSLAENVVQEQLA